MTVTAESLLTPAEHDLLGRLGGGEETARRIIADRVGPAWDAKHEILAKLGYQVTADGHVVPLPAADAEVDVEPAEIDPEAVVALLEELEPGPEKAGKKGA